MESKRQQRILRWLIPVAIVLLLLGSCVQKWPHYNASAPGAHVTETLMFMRGTWGEQVHLPVGDGAELAARAICYPPQPGGNQGCHLIIDLMIQRPTNISFTGGAFVARDPSNHEIRFDSGKPYEYPGNCPAAEFEEQSWCVAMKASVQLDYELPPRLFELLIPGVTIDGENVVVPPIQFEYDDFLAYQFVPWIVNY